MGWRAEEFRLDSRQGQETFLVSTASEPVLKPTQPPIQWVLGAVSSEVKRQGREADRAEIKDGGDISPLLNSSE
jgi:predicted secreted Zn-dependent protease